MPLPDILQWAAAGRKTGTLHVSRGARSRSGSSCETVTSTLPGRTIPASRSASSWSGSVSRARSSSSARCSPRRRRADRSARSWSRTASSTKRISGARSGSRPRRRSTISSSGPRASSSSTKARSPRTSRSRSRRR